MPLRRTLTKLDGVVYIDDWKVAPSVSGYSFEANDTTPSVAQGIKFKTANTSSTTITDFDGTLGDYHEVTVFVNDNYTTVAHDATKIEIPGDTNITFQTGDIFKILSMDGIWYLSLVRFQT